MSVDKIIRSVFWDKILENFEPEITNKIGQKVSNNIWYTFNHEFYITVQDKILLKEVINNKIHTKIQREVQREVRSTL